MPRAEGWATTAALLPQKERMARELPFWRSVTARFPARRVLDAGCGAGFHLSLLSELGLNAVGFDVAFAPLVGMKGSSVLTADLLALPFPPESFDLVLCLGNTISLLDNRRQQSTALADVARVLTPGGTAVLQGEDVSQVVLNGPTLRVRNPGDGSVHIRVFLPRGRKVEMLAGLAPPGVDAHLETTELLSTNATHLTRLTRPLGLTPVPLPDSPPAGPSTFWLALRKSA